MKAGQHAMAKRDSSYFLHIVLEFIDFGKVWSTPFHRDVLTLEHSLSLWEAQIRSSDLL